MWFDFVNWLALSTFNEQFYTIFSIVAWNLCRFLFGYHKFLPFFITISPYFSLLFSFWKCVLFWPLLLLFCSSSLCYCSCFSLYLHESSFMYECFGKEWQLIFCFCFSFHFLVLNLPKFSLLFWMFVHNVHQINCNLHGHQLISLHSVQTFNSQFEKKMENEICYVARNSNTKISHSKKYTHKSSFWTGYDFCKSITISQSHVDLTYDSIQTTVTLHNQHAILWGYVYIRTWYDSLLKILLTLSFHQNCWILDIVTFELIDEMEATASEPQMAKDAVLTKSVKLPDVTPIVQGYDWNNGINYDQLLSSYLTSGFQATNFGKAVEEINKMVRIIFAGIFFCPLI